MKLGSKKKSTSFFGKLIKCWAKISSPFSKKTVYCHSELIFSNDEWFSSREFHGAVSFSKGCPSGDTYDMYDFIELPISAEDEERIKKWCEKERFNDDGTLCRYDIRGVLFSFLPIPIGWQSPKDWFCSEICVAALQSTGWLAGYTASAIAPTDLPILIQKEIKYRLK